MLSLQKKYSSSGSQGFKFNPSNPLSNFFSNCSSNPPPFGRSNWWMVTLEKETNHNLLQKKPLWYGQNYQGYKLTVSSLSRYVLIYAKNMSPNITEAIPSLYMMMLYSYWNTPERNMDVWVIYSNSLVVSDVGVVDLVRGTAIKSLMS